MDYVDFAPRYIINKSKVAPAADAELADAVAEFADAVALVTDAVSEFQEFVWLVAAAF